MKEIIDPDFKYIISTILSIRAAEVKRKMNKMEDWEKNVQRNALALLAISITALISIGVVIGYLL